MQAIQTVSAELGRLRAELEQARADNPRGSSAHREAFERLLRAADAAGQPLDALAYYTADETERFFARTVAGADGHVYWTAGKHFYRNDGRGRLPRRWWWERATGETLGPRDVLASVCDEPNCINPEHCRREALQRARIYSDEAMLGALQVAAMRHGRPLHVREWDALHLRPSSGVYQTRFGTWKDAVRAAGLEYHYVTPNTSASADDCLASLRFVERRLGHWPSNREFRESRAALIAAGHISSHSTIIRHLGNWPEALRKAAA